MVIGRLLGMCSSSARHLGLRLEVLACYAVLAAAFGVLLLGPVLGMLHGNAFAFFATGALISFAVGCFTSALQTLLGLAGALLSVVALVIIGNPASGGGQIPSAMMPSAWSWLAHVLPNPAGMAAIRGIEFFASYATGQAFLVLALCAGVGIAVMVGAAVVLGLRPRSQAPAGQAGLTADLVAEAGPGAML
jgi:hypothetical protein